MDDFKNVISKDPRIQDKINSMLDRYIKLPCKYQAKIGYDCLIQNVTLEELIKIMGATVTELDFEKN